MLAPRSGCTLMAQFKIKRATTEEVQVPAADADEQFHDSDLSW